MLPTNATKKQIPIERINFNAFTILSIPHASLVVKNMSELRQVISIVIT